MDENLAHILDLHFQDGRSRAAAKAILGQTKISHIQYAEEPLVAALVVDMVDSVQPQSASLPPPELTYIWLHLRSGHVFMLKLVGDIKPTKDRLPRFANQLQGTIETIEDFRLAESRLNAFCAACSVKLHRFGLAVPNITFLVDVNEVHGLGRIEAIGRASGMPLIEAEWEPLAAHFYRLLGENNPDIKAFHAGLNADALHMLDLIASSFPTDANQVLVFNFFAGGSSKQRRYRIQAAIQLPWLIPLLTGLQLDDWRLDSSSGDDEWPKHWQHIRPIIVDAIDSGQPLFACVARCFNVPRSVIAWSRYQVMPTLRHIRYNDIDTILRLLAAIPVQHRPASEEEWEMLDRRISQYVEVISASYSIPPFLLLPERGLSTERGQVIEWIMIRWLRLESSGGVEFGSVGLVTAFLMALAEALYDHLEGRCDRRRAMHQRHEEIMLGWLLDMTLRELTEMAARWQRTSNEAAKKFYIAWQLVQNSRVPIVARVSRDHEWRRESRGDN